MTTQENIAATPRRRLFHIGIMLTFVVGLSAAIAFWKYPCPDNNICTINTIGDFLAGFGSLAVLIWVVIGYLQNARDIAINSEALYAQREEMQQLVAIQTKQEEQARTMTMIQKEQQAFEARRHKQQIRPTFRIEVTEADLLYETFFCQVLVHNQPVRNLRLTGGDDTNHIPNPLLPSQEPHSFKINSKGGKGTRLWNFECEDEDGNICRYVLFYEIRTGKDISRFMDANPPYRETTG